MSANMTRLSYICRYPPEKIATQTNHGHQREGGNEWRTKSGEQTDASGNLVKQEIQYAYTCTERELTGYIWPMLREAEGYTKHG